MTCNTNIFEEVARLHTALQRHDTALRSINLLLSHAGPCAKIDPRVADALHLAREALDLPPEARAA